MIMNYNKYCHGKDRISSFRLGWSGKYFGGSDIWSYIWGMSWVGRRELTCKKKRESGGEEVVWTLAYTRIENVGGDKYEKVLRVTHTFSHLREWSSLQVGEIGRESREKFRQNKFSCICNIQLEMSHSWIFARSKFGLSTDI